MSARRPSNVFEIEKNFCTAINDQEKAKMEMEDQYKEQNRQILRRRLAAGMLLLCMCYICVLVLLYMCSHTTTSRTDKYFVAVSLKVYVCPHTTICMCPHITIYMFPHTAVRMCLHTTIYMCVLILLLVEQTNTASTSR